jgi:hypothetical protein
LVRCIIPLLNDAIPSEHLVFCHVDVLDYMYIHTYIHTHIYTIPL